MFRRARHQNGSLQRVKRKSGRRGMGTSGGTKPRSTAARSTARLCSERSRTTRPRPKRRRRRTLYVLPSTNKPLGSNCGRSVSKPWSSITGSTKCRTSTTRASSSRERCAEDEGRKTYATQDTYQGYLKKWILPRWKSYRLPDIKPVQVEQWLKSLALAPGSKAKIRNIMSALFSHALRWEWATRNPIAHVRQSAKRRNIPVVLTIEQIQAFLSHLEDPSRTAVLLDISSGLRVGELLGLKWEDVHFESLEVNITRSVVKQRITRCKTEASRQVAPTGLFEHRLEKRFGNIAGK